jgi:transposase
MKQDVTTDKEHFVAAIKNEMSRTPEGRYFHRLHVVLQYLQGNRSAEIARLYGHSPRTIQYWIRRLRTDGLTNLWDGKRPGRPGRLSKSQREKLRNQVQHTPRELGYGQDIWNGSILSYHLEEHYGIKLSIRQCQRLLRQLGFSSFRKKGTLHCGGGKINDNGEF